MFKYYADQTEVRANRQDARIVVKERRKITLLKMRCPWVENRQQREVEKS